MYYKIIFIFIFILPINCFARISPYLLFEDLHQRMNTINLNTDGKFGETYKSYEQLVSIIDDFTKFNNDFTNKVLIGLRQDEVLRGLQLTLLHKSVKYYLMMSSKMITLAEQIEPEDLREIDDTFYVGSEEKKRKTLLWYAIHMKNLDHFLKTYSTYLHNKKLRLLLNDADSAFELKSDELKNYIATMISKKSVKIYQRATRGFNLVNDYGEHNQLKESIYTMYSTSLISETGKKGLYKIRKDLKKGYRKDKWSKVGRFLLHHASGFFGNRMGAIKFRKGFLLNNSKLNTQITKILRPLDIITEKTPFILTDKFIPGHFGHNAVWLGTKDQLIKTGMWDHPRIIPLRGMIEKGYSIIETDRSGTHLKNIDKFMNVDWFAIMRLQKTFVDENYLKNTYEAALSQLGKLYDFNFDVETTHKLVCSELLYQSFGEVVWPTERYLGRTTISPDNIASLALYENTPMSLVYYVRGDENKNVIDLTEDRWAIDLGFRKNIDLSTDALSYYERPYKKCVNIIKSNNKRKVCTTTYKHYVYKPLSNY